MNIDNNVNGIVQTIISQITSQVQSQVAVQIDAKITDIINNLDTTSILANQLSQKLDAKLNQLPIDSKSIESQLSAKIDKINSTIGETVQNQSIAKINESINAQINKIDFKQLIQLALESVIKNQTFNYPDNSIPHNAIDVSNLVLNGNNIAGGIISNFGSTGIDDKATSCQLSIFDNVTVVENNLLTKDLTVKGTVTIEGDLNVTGTVPNNSPFYQNLVDSTANVVRSKLNEIVFDSYATKVFSQIKDNGIDLNKVTFNGQILIDGGNLGSNIINSNLQKVGTLTELQVQGESFLSGTFYTTRQRVGINTIEPAQALSVWDQEIEVGIGKLSNNTALLGTPRPQTLVLSSNGKNNVTLETDGSVSVQQLNLGQIILIASISPPSDSKPKGTIVFNMNPTLGGPLGWVSLGDARWANFGIID